MRLFIKLFTASAVFIASMSLGASATAGGPYVTKDEDAVLKMVNQTRANKGLKPLVRNSKLVLMARGQSDRMAKKGNIYHNPNLGSEATAHGLDWERVGENVGMGPNVTVIEEAFLDSPGHYANIVHASYNHAGIGVVRVSSQRVYVTQVFADLAGSTAPAPASSKPAPAVKPAPKPATPAPAAATPNPTVAPKTAPPATPKPRSVYPNAAIGGLVKDSQVLLTGVPGASAAGSSGTLAAGSFSDDRTLAKVVDLVVFWA